MTGSKMDCDDGVAELVLHLAAAGLGFAQIAEADGEAVQLGGDGAEVVIRTPLDARGYVSLADALGAFRDFAQWLDDRVDGDRGEDESQQGADLDGGEKMAAPGRLFVGDALGFRRWPDVAWATMSGVARGHVAKRTPHIERHAEDDRHQ